MVHIFTDLVGFVLFCGTYIYKLAEIVNKISHKLKKHLNKVIEIESLNKSNCKGILLDFNEDWIYILNNPVDYVTDGFSFIRRKNISNINRDKNTKLIEKAIYLKGFDPSKIHKVQFENIQQIFEELNKKYGIFQFQNKSTKAIFPGKLVSVNENDIVIQWIDLNAKWTNNRTFPLKKIRRIEFQNDYLISLNLLANSK
jgi:hypothetical protein